MYSSTKQWKKISSIAYRNSSTALLKAYQMVIGFKTTNSFISITLRWLGTWRKNTTSKQRTSTIVSRKISSWLGSSSKTYSNSFQASLKPPAIQNLHIKRLIVLWNLYSLQNITKYSRAGLWSSNSIISFLDLLRSNYMSRAKVKYSLMICLSIWPTRLNQVQQTALEKWVAAWELIKIKVIVISLIALWLMEYCCKASYNCLKNKSSFHHSSTERHYLEKHNFRFQRRISVKFPKIRIVSMGFTLKPNMEYWILWISSAVLCLFFCRIISQSNQPNLQRLQTYWDNL